MENELISIIVPVYKVEMYLARCVDTILAQTYTNIEVILVDDGSPDNCGKICDRYSQRDLRVRVIHQANSGLADARNAGMKIAKGKWFGFVDSDDYIDVNMYRTLYELAKEKNADIAVCGTKRVYENAAETTGEATDDNNNREVSEYTNIEALKVYLDRRDGIIGSHAWDKLYKRELFSDITYPSGRKYGEDTATTFKVIYKAEKIAATNQCLVNYLQRNDSLMGVKYSEANLDALISIKEQVDFFKEKSTELYKYAAIKYFNFLRMHYFKVLKFIPNSKADVLERIREYNSLYKKDISIMELVRHPAGWGFNLPYLAFWISPKLGTLLRGK